MIKKIYLATDHAGFEFKEETKQILKNNFAEIEIIDGGAFDYDPDDDYPDFIIPVAKKISQNPNNCRAIIFGGSGQGEAIAANRFANVRAVVYYGYDEDILRLSRDHNDANILSLGARFIKKENLEKILNIWLFQEFSEKSRHQRRIAKLENTK